MDTAEDVVDAGEAAEAVVDTAEDEVDAGEAAVALVDTAEDAVDAGEAAEGLSLLVEFASHNMAFFHFQFL